MEVLLASHDSISLELAANAMRGPKVTVPHRSVVEGSDHTTRVGEMIKKARAHLGKSYADVAREIYGEITDGKGHTTGRNRNLISSWERGKTLPRQNILPKLAEAIEADLEVLTRARQQDEADRRGALMPEPDFTAGAVAGRPDLVVLSVKAVVPIADFARIVQDIAASAQSVEHEEDEEAVSETEQ